jgi:hypothetical protein
MVKEQLLDYIRPYIQIPIEYIDSSADNNVLINSNFNCGYYINRDKLYSILRSDKYCIETAFDPCSYPGVKCKFYFNNEIGFDIIKQTGQLVKEGSCLIVGNCTEKKLYFVYDFIKRLLYEEYPVIYVHNENTVVKEKKMKLRKKQVVMTKEYYDNHVIN